MNKQNLFFCMLIKNIIHPNKNIYIEDEIDWSYMVGLAKEHNLLSLFVNEAIKYSEYISRPEYERETEEVMVSVANQVKRTHAFLKLYDKMVQENIHPIVMKGLICRRLYGELCDHRPSGDEDILISFEDFKKTERILIENGYISELDNVTETQLKQLQEVSFINPTTKLHIELHVNLMGRDNDVRSKMSDCFKDVFKEYMDIEINGTMIRTMTHSQHLLYLILHAFKHFIGGGFGIRQILDILLYQEQYGSYIDLVELNNILIEFKANRFWADLIHIGNMYFGFELPTIEEANYVEELLQDIMTSGVFGNKTHAERAAARVTKIATGNFLKKNKINIFAIVIHSLFPSKAFLLNEYPYLEEKPWMLPFEWIKRLGRFIKRCIKNNDNLAVKGMKISQRRIDLLKKYDLV